MSKEELELIAKIKERVFDERKCILCFNSFWCPTEDGYCPTYDCGSLDKLKSYNDRQWLNAIKKIQSIEPNISFEDLVDEVLCGMRHKRPSYCKK